MTKALTMRPVHHVRALYRSHVPLRARAKLRFWQRSLDAVWYSGQGRECPACQQTFRRFKDAGDRVEAQCPGCGLFERHRSLWHYLRNETDLFSAPRAVLEIGPLTFSQRIFKGVEHIDYISGDLEPGRAMVTLDIQELPFEDDRFDVILCYSVLETVPDDRQGLRELRRVLRPGGVAFVHVYVDYRRTETFVDPDAVSEEDRLRAYGGQWNRRINGRDFINKLTTAGFDVEAIAYPARLGEQSVERHGLHGVPYFFRCTLADSDVGAATWDSTGSVTDIQSCAPIPGATVCAHDEQGTEIGRTECTAEGHWLMRAGGAVHKWVFEAPAHQTRIVDASGFGEFQTSPVQLLARKLIGYTNRLSVSAGETLGVHVNAPASYEASLVRYGETRDTVSTMGSHDAVEQALPNGDLVAEGMQWPSTIDVDIPADAEPGLYSVELRTRGAKASSTDDGFSATFVVSRPHAEAEERPLLVIASTTTWQAYNDFGGRSVYRNHFNGQAWGNDVTAAGRHPLGQALRGLLPLRTKQALRRMLNDVRASPSATTPLAANSWICKPLSNQRPFPKAQITSATVTDAFDHHGAEAEWRVLAFLEREGFEYNVVSCRDLHDNPGLLAGYRACLLNTHAEYWSREMFDGLRRFNDDGGWVLNFSGNSIYREVTFDDDSMRCVSLLFGESCADETDLLGVRFDMKGFQTRAPFSVLEPRHWLFESTGLRKGELFATSGLNGGGGSGWETDKLIRPVSDGFTVVGRGTNPDGGGADMVVREPGRGRGGLFSASSITFGGTLLVDDKTATVARNAIARACAPR